MSFAWLQLSRQWHIDVSTLPPQHERLELWKNQVRFLCMALRPALHGMASLDDFNRLDMNEDSILENRIL